MHPSPSSGKRLTRWARWSSATRVMALIALMMSLFMVLLVVDFAAGHSARGSSFLWRLVPGRLRDDDELKIRQLKLLSINQPNSLADVDGLNETLNAWGLSRQASFHDKLADLLRAADAEIAQINASENIGSHSQGHSSKELAFALRDGSNGVEKEVQAQSTGPRGNISTVDLLQDDVLKLRKEAQAIAALKDVILARSLVVDGRLTAANQKLSQAVLTEHEQRINGSDQVEDRLLDKLREEATVLKHLSDQVSTLKAELVVMGRNVSEFYTVGGGVGTGLERPRGACPKGVESALHLATPTQYLEWKPEPRRFLLALCTMGQMSNRLACFHEYLGLAALLNRSLVVPLEDVGGQGTGYDLRWVFDIPHARKCLGPGTILSTTEYMEWYKQPAVDVQLHCLWRGRSGVGWCGFRQGWKQLERSPHLRLVGTTKGRLPMHPTKEEFLAVYGMKEDAVISFGDVNYIGYFNMSFIRQGPNGPLRLQDPSCKLAIQSDPAIWETADTILRSLLGRRYLGVHLRRGDFESYCASRGNVCYKPLTQIADCIATRLNALGGSITTIYLATNAEKKEIEYLQQAILAQTRIKYVFLGLSDVLTVKWNAPLRKKGWSKIPQVWAALEKIIVAMSKVFLGSPISTFTRDILRIRQGYGLSTCLDDMICSADPADGLKLFSAESETEESQEEPQAGSGVLARKKIRSPQNLQASKVAKAQAKARAVAKKRAKLRAKRPPKVAPT